MKKLKEILLRKDIQENIRANFNMTEEELKIAIEKTLRLTEDNITSIQMGYHDNRIVEFENTLHVDAKKEVYFLECRLFDKKDESMLNAYLEIIDFNGEIVKGCNDVWDYANWKVV